MEPQPSAKKPESPVSIRLILAAVALLLLVITVAQNTDLITVRFLVWEFSISQIVLITMVGLAGVLVGYAIGRMKRPVPAAKK